MDETLKPGTPTDSPRPRRAMVDHWRGDIRKRPPAWRRRPRSELVRDVWKATRPLLAQIGEGKSWL